VTGKGTGAHGTDENVGRMQTRSPASSSRDRKHRKQNREVGSDEKKVRMLDQREARTPGEGEGICIVEGCRRDQRSTEREGGQRTPTGGRVRKSTSDK
jgi:hypothetical protein